MQFLPDYGLFLAKTITLTGAFLVLTLGIAAIKAKHKSKESLIIKKLNQKYQDMQRDLQAEVLSKAELKKVLKQQKKAEKNRQPYAKRLFVVHFDGDIRASQVHHLREAINAILTLATHNDEVVVRLESAGGMVHAYGLAASQLDRLKRRHIPLTVCIDKVAASGGYMMAAVADKILAAPFAIIGSIGVVAQIPNFNRLLKKNHVDFEMLTAGEFKRTLTLFGENTDKGRQKLQEEIEETHQLFKQFLAEHRPQLDVDQVATGEHWLACRAKDLNLVDDLITSDDYLLNASLSAEVIEIEYRIKRSFSDRLSGVYQKAAQLLASTH